VRGVLTPAVVSRGGEIDENSKLSKEMLGKALSNMGKTLSDQEVAASCASHALCVACSLACMPPCSADDRAVSPPPQLSDVFNLADANGDGGVSFEVQRAALSLQLSQHPTVPYLALRHLAGVLRRLVHA